MLPAFVTSVTLTAADAVRILADDPTPKGEDVKAGWIGFGVFLTLVLVTALICIAFYRSMKRVNSADKEGVYGTSSETPAEEESAEAGTRSTEDS